MLESEWQELVYFFGTYSSSLGHHFIIWRTSNGNKRDYEIVCHRRTSFTSHLRALAACESWIQSQLIDCEEVIHEDPVLVLEWLEEQKSKTVATRERKRSSDRRGRKKKKLLSIPFDVAV